MRLCAFCFGLWLGFGLVCSLRCLVCLYLAFVYVLWVFITSDLGLVCSGSWGCFFPVCFKFHRDFLWVCTC